MNVPSPADHTEDATAMVDGLREPRLASVWDLDGTLVSTDTFVESVGTILTRRPWLIPSLFLWLFRGRGYCKGRVAAVAAVPPSTWPVRPEAAALLRQMRHSGRLTVLATAAHRTVAEGIASHLGCFDAVLASDERVNLKGATKLSAIQSFIAAHGLDGFAYAGDSYADMQVWRGASEVIVVAPTPHFESHVRRLGKPTIVLGKASSRLHAVWKACRPHQWAKNLLLFIPMLLAHKLDVATLGTVLAAFVSFSLCASGVYILNDIGDMAADRSHPKKRLRPLAAGTLSVATGLQLAMVLLVSAVAIAGAGIPPPFIVLIAVYVVANYLYSGLCKQVPILDVMTLACFYALRLEAGAVAAAVPLSPWMLTFALFFFTSLAFSKRYTELRRLHDRDGLRVAGRGYFVDDIELVEQLGVASGYVSVLVLALYMNSPEMRAIYGDSRILWLICPIVLYWITRLWLLARRGRLDDDPVVFALKDRQSLGLAATSAALVLLSTWLSGAAR